MLCLSYVSYCLTLFKIKVSHILRHSKERRLSQRHQDCETVRHNGKIAFCINVFTDEDRRPSNQHEEPEQHVSNLCLMNNQETRI